MVMADEPSSPRTSIVSGEGSGDGVAEFSQRAAIVTGGAQGSGRAIAQRLLAAGAQARIRDRDEQLLTRTIAEFGAGGSGDVIDMTYPHAAARATNAIVRDLGREDILVNN